MPVKDDLIYQLVESKFNERNSRKENVHSLVTEHKMFSGSIYNCIQDTPWHLYDLKANVLF